MKKQVCMSILATTLLLSSCGGNDPLAKKGAVDPNNSDLLPTTTAPEITTLNASDIINAEIEARKNKESMNGDVKNAIALLEEAGKLDAGSEQAAIREKINAAKAIAEKLAENDDFFLASEDILAGVTDIEKKMAAFVAVGELPITADLGGKFGGITIKALARSSGNIFAIVDKGIYGPIAADNIDKIQEIAFPEGVNGQNGSYSIKFGALYVTANPSQVFALNGKEFIKQKVKDNAPFAPASQFTTYGNNLYIIDALSNKLVKYENIGNGTFAGPNPVLPDGALAGKAISGVAIDGSIYVLAFGESIKKYMKNEEIPMTIDRDYKGANLSTRLYTDQGSSFLYVFDPENKKLLRYRKGADSLSIDKEYTLSRTYSGIFIAPGDKNAYLSEGNKVYTLAL